MSLNKIIEIKITEPSPLDIGEIRMIHQECMSEFATLNIKNALWNQFSLHNDLDCEDVELIDFKWRNECYTGRFRVRLKLEIAGDKLI